MERHLCALSTICILSSSTTAAFCFFFFNDTATTEIYTLSLHDALPISSFTLCAGSDSAIADQCCVMSESIRSARSSRDRKSTRLNSSHTVISYAVFCLKKKKKEQKEIMKEWIS